MVIENEKKSHEVNASWLKIIMEFYFMNLFIAIAPFEDVVFNK